MQELLEADGTVGPKMARVDVISASALRVSPRLTVRTQIKSIESNLETRTLALSVAVVMACSREGCVSGA